MTFSNTRMMMITSTTPMVPDGKYPQEREYPQFGMAPIRTRIRMMMRMVPRVIASSSEGDEQERRSCGEDADRRDECTQHRAQMDFAVVSFGRPGHGHPGGML